MKRINPIVKPVIETFQTVYAITSQFATNPNSAINGLLVMGDAGTGKSHFVQQALVDNNVTKNVQFMVGGTVTAASLYVTLWNNRHSNRIILLDDVDIIGHPEKSKIIPMILGASQEGRDRRVSWNTAKKNALMEEYDAPFDFQFNGKIIVITNYVQDDINKKMPQWGQAFSSRFTPVSCIFNHEQKYMYTKHLIENLDMLGSNCKVHQYMRAKQELKGYPPRIVRDTLNFIDDEYMNFTSITPRIAIKIADTIYYTRDKQMRSVLLQNLVV